MFDYPLIAWIRRKFSVLTIEELDTKDINQEADLEDWRKETKNMFWKVRECDKNEEPYTTYFFDYCQYCNSFKPIVCFTNDGKIIIERVLNYSKLTLNIEKLDIIHNE